MSLFVYIANECNSDAQTHGLTGEVERFRERVEDTQSTSLFDPFPPPYLVKKKLGGRQGRLIASVHNAGEHTVIVFLAIMIRGSRAYEAEFSNDPVAYGSQHFAGLVTEEQIQAYVAQQTRAVSRRVKRQPSDLEYSLLYNAFAHRAADASETLVCETKYWVEAVSTDRIAKQLAVLAKPCLDALSIEDGLHFIPVTAKSGWGVWALKKLGRVILIAPSTDATSEQARQYAQEQAAQLRDADSNGLLRASRRAYPAIVLADDDLWIDLEKELVANFALSPEESEVLESARSSTHPFPLFINGRAGSGKSTILQYLFTDLLFSYLCKPDTRSVAPPMYFTVNRELLRNAREFVARLLKSEATLAQQSSALSDDEKDEILQASFGEFYDYILGLVEPAARWERFARGNRVDYARFRSMWMDRFGKDRHALRDFGPELSWHVIRSYIKGMSSETYLEPQDYTQLPENQLTVSQESYQLVYERVWSGWYQEATRNVGLWDDQDLTRFVLEEELAKPVHPAVFCDEAQDFTRLELELLLRINLFSDRTLAPTDVPKVCFAFAGDQFQTLNPTGFRWDAIKATFVEKFIFEMDPSRRGAKTDLNYRELRFNYRSSDRIVRFSNLVQAARAALFRVPELRPQEPWTETRHVFSVSWFRSGDGNFWRKFRESTSFVVIVPCAEGEEADFVRRDVNLREHIKFEDSVPLNVLSASRAKGCEYPAVIVYGFGDELTVNVLDELNKMPGELAIERSRNLSLQYFVNRLYVAVSRPKQRLVIVDSEDGLDRLWRFACDESAEARVLEAIKNGKELWGDLVEGMSAGDPEDLLNDVATDPTENAKAFERDAHARHDSFLFRQAAQAYRSAGDSAKSRECRARALECDGQFREAGELFCQGGFEFPDGVRCLWRAGQSGWSQLAKLGHRKPEIRQEPEIQIAELLIASPNIGPTIQVLNDFAGRLDEPAFADACAGVPQWRDSLGEVLRRLSTAKDQRIEIGEWKRLATALDRVRQRGVFPKSEDCGPVFFSAGRYADAVAAWDDAGSVRDARYNRAKAFAESYPQRIVPLANLKAWPEIAKAYRSAAEISLTSEQAGWVIMALLQEGDLRSAYQVGWNARCAEPLLKVAVEAFRRSELSLSRRALRGAVVGAVAQKNWDIVAMLLPPAEFRPEALKEDSEAQKWVADQLPDLRNWLVRALARRSDLAAAPPQFQRRWSDFLREYLRIRDRHWRTEITIEEAGAAIERAGRFTDAIAYYEALRTQKINESHKRFTKERLLVSRERQLRHEQAQRASGKSHQLERDLKQAMASLHIDSIAQLPEFPELPELGDLNETSEPSRDASSVNISSTLKRDTTELTVNTELPDRLEAAVGTFLFEVSRKIGRLNIKNNETMETAYLKCASRECGGEMAFKKINSEQWTCDQWKLTIRHGLHSREVSVVMEEAGATVQFVI